jgi:hypothetical protein
MHRSTSSSVRIWLLSYIHTYKIYGKMAGEVSQNIEDALNKMVNTTDHSGIMRKELKKPYLKQ